MVRPSLERVKPTRNGFADGVDRLTFLSRGTFLLSFFPQGLSYW